MKVRCFNFKVPEGASFQGISFSESTLLGKARCFGKHVTPENMLLSGWISVPRGNAEGMVRAKRLLEY